MAETIANWAVKLSADATGLVQGLQASASTMQGFASRAAIISKTAASSAVASLKTITGINLSGPAADMMQFGGALAGVGQGVFTGGIIGLATAGVALSGVMLTIANNTINSVAQLERFGSRVGLTAQEAAGLRSVAERARVPWDEMDDVVSKWGVRLGELNRELANPGGGAMVGMLEAMGINARAFASANLGEQFRMLREGTQSIENPMQRLAALGEVVGRRNAQTVMRLLNAPGADFGNLAEMGRQAGHDFTPEQGQSMLRLQKQIEETKIQAGQIFTQMAGPLAMVATPAIASVALAVRALVEQGRSLAPIIGAGMVYVFGPFSALITGISLLVAGLAYGVGYVYERIQAGIARVMPFVTLIIGTVSPLISSIGETVSLTFEMLAEKFAWVGGLVDLWWDGVKFAAIGVLVVIGGAVIAALLGVTTAVEFTSAILARLLARSRDAIRSLAEATNNDTLRNFASSLDRGASSMTRIATSAGEAGRGIVSAVQALPGLLGQAGSAASMASQSWEHFAYAARRNFGQVTGPQLTAQLAAASAVMGLFNTNTNAPNAGGWSELASRMESENRLALLTREQAEMTRLQATNEYAIANAGIRRLMEDRLALAQREREINEDILRLRQNAEQVREQTRSPLETFRSGMEQLEEQLGRGMFGPETFRRRAEQLFNDLEKNDRTRQDRSPAAVLAGTVQEQAAIVASQRQERDINRNPQERIRATLERMEQHELQARRQREEMVVAIREIMVERMGN